MCKLVTIYGDVTTSLVRLSGVHGKHSHTYQHCTCITMHHHTNDTLVKSPSGIRLLDAIKLLVLQPVQALTATAQLLISFRKCF